MDEDWREMHRRLRPAPTAGVTPPRDTSLCAFCGEKLGGGADCSTCGTPLPEWQS